MSNRDWSLVFFTTLSQWSVGIILCLTWPVFVNHDSSLVFITEPNLANPVLLALILIAGATVSSFLHLGNPMNAPKALNNLSSSWLSREIFTIGIFSASLVFILLLGWGSDNPRFLRYLMALSSMCGLALLWTMIRIYVMPTIPAWNSWYTPVSFVSTALSLGLVSLLVLQANGLVNVAGHIIRSASIALATMLLIGTGSGFAYQSYLRRLDPGMDDLVFDSGVFYRLFLFRMALLIIALMMIVFAIPNASVLEGMTGPSWLYPLFGLILLQELIGRLLFYSAYFRTGV